MASPESVVRPLRILWTMPYLPWPTTSGGKSRQYHLLRRMAERGHRITLLVQSKAPLDDEGRARLEPLVEQLIVLPRRPLRQPLTLWHAALSPWPLLTTVNGHAPALADRFEAMGTRTFVTKVDVDNEPVRRAIAKLGGRQIARMELVRLGPFARVRVTCGCAPRAARLSPGEPPLSPGEPRVPLGQGGLLEPRVADSI